MSNQNITTFPKFTKIDISHQAEIKSLIEKFPTYSDFGFTSMLAWGTKNDFLVSKLEDNLVVKFSDYISHKPFLSILGEKNIDECLKILVNYSVNEGWGPSLHLVPESVVKRIQNKNSFSVEEDEDSFDYILSVIYHAELEGPKNQDRRYRISAFKKRYGNDLSIKNLDLKNSESRFLVLECFDHWSNIRKLSKSKVEDEKEAIKNLLEFSDQINLKCLGVFCKDSIIGFSIFEIIHKNHCAVHFEKGNLEYKGIAHLIRHEVAKDLHKSGVEFINYEQDLGIEGLRNSKRMLHPVHYLKKYKITLKN